MSLGWSIGVACNQLRATCELSSFNGGSNAAMIRWLAFAFSYANDTLDFEMLLKRVAISGIFHCEFVRRKQFPTSSNAFEFAALQCMAWWWVENLFRIYSRVVFQVEIVMTKVLCSLFFSLNLTYGLMNLQSNNLPALFHVASCRLSSSCLFPYLHHHRVLFSRSTRLFLIVTRLNVNAYIFIAF